MTRLALIAALVSDKSVIRYTVTVTLTLKDRKGKVTFAVALKNPVVVSRDPYY